MVAETKKFHEGVGEEPGEQLQHQLSHTPQGRRQPGGDKRARLRWHLLLPASVRGPEPGTGQGSARGRGAPSPSSQGCPPSWPLAIKP